MGETFAYPSLLIKNNQMKQIKGFELRNIAGEHVVVATGKDNIDFSRIISMNATSAWLWQAVEGISFDAGMLCDLLTTRYDVDISVALADAEDLLERWLAAGIITKD